MYHPQIHLEERIDSGGIAELFRGTLTCSGGLQKTVAVKRILPHLALDLKFRQIFEQEVSLLVNLQHPSISRSLYSGEHGGYLYLVNEFVEGKSLAQLLAQCHQENIRIPAEISCAIVSNVAEGLYHVYSSATDHDGSCRHVAHGCINPSTILVSYSGQVKIIDFGIMKSLQHSQSGQTERFHETRCYLAPEQHHCGTLDHQSDVFSLGVVFWELLTQRSDLSGESVQLQKKIDNSPVPPSSVQADLPEELDRIVLKAVSGNKNLRYSSAREFAQDLQRLCIQNSWQTDDDEMKSFMKATFSEIRFAEKRDRRCSREGPSDSIVTRSDAFLPYSETSATHSNVEQKNREAHSNAKIRDRFQGTLLFLLPTLAGLIAALVYLFVVE